MDENKSYLQNNLLKTHLSRTESMFVIKILQKCCEKPTAGKSKCSRSAINILP